MTETVFYIFAVLLVFIIDTFMVMGSNSSKLLFCKVLQQPQSIDAAQISESNYKCL
jgi:hypothetical protein